LFLLFLQSLLSLLLVVFVRSLQPVFSMTPALTKPTRVYNHSTNFSSQLFFLFDGWASPA
jgi:hypothetical protein